MINIPYKKKDFKVRLQAFHYTNTAKNQIAYKISGNGNDWVIRNGSYVEINKELANKDDALLQVKACNADGIWTNIKTIQFRITPPFWKKGWFFHLLY
ncbi:MAG: hypothetical protein HC905_08840 [Bacteroidales bacterium]|nr:hypothetical protein [Bacteroidales bacterium]